MKHLFIVNPNASLVKGRANEIVEEIETFFHEYGELEYDIHVTRWARDASGYAHRYAAEADGLVRVHSLGGAGTLFEIANGVIGLPNAQIAAYPMGGCNDFIRYFGADKTHLFRSLRSQVFSRVIRVDAIRCGSSYGLSYGMVGLEAKSDMEGSKMIDNTSFPIDLCHIWAAISCVVNSTPFSQSLKIVLDGENLDGAYISILIAGGPCYGKDFSPAVDAHPNDGLLDIYMVSDISRSRFVASMPKYLYGQYAKLPGIVKHYRGKHIALSSDEIMCISIDGETFHEHSIEYEVIPYAVDFVCPTGVDVKKLPKVYGKPREGLVSDR